MRALVLLGLVVVSFLLFVRFFPESSVEGASLATPAAVDPVGAQAELLEEPTRASGEDSPGFLTRAEAPAQATPDRAERLETPVSPATPAPEAASWLAGVEPAPARDEGEVDVAAALLHGTDEDVRLAAASIAAFPRDRSCMAEAFAMAMSGRAREGLLLAGELDEAKLSAREKTLLQAALGGEPVRGGLLNTSAVNASAALASGAESPLVLAMEMALLEVEAREDLRSRRYAPAARAFSTLLLTELDAPWRASRTMLADWTDGLDEAQKNHRWAANGAWPAVEYTVPPGGTAIGIRKSYLADHPGTIMCSGLILRSNAVRGYLQANQVLRVPTDTVRMLVDLSARWALYLAGGEVAASWPVGVGRAGEETITGDFTAGNKTTEPAWMRVGYDPVPFGDPANPLGTRWIGWFEAGTRTSYGFHGTKEPASIGTASSDGCIRFHNENVERLFEILPEGAPIHVRD